MVLFINFQKDYLKSIKENSINLNLKTELQVLENLKSSKNVDLEIIREEILFLKSNKSIGGNQTLTASTFKEAANYYGNKIKTLKTAEYRLKIEIQKIEKSISNIKKQINEVKPKINFGTGEIIIRLKSKVAKHIKFALNCCFSSNSPSWYIIAFTSTPLDVCCQLNKTFVTSISFGLSHSHFL